MKIYIDHDYKCHVSPDEGLHEFDVPFFDDKCPEFVEGYRYVPAGESWRREDGEVFRGEMISPWKHPDKLQLRQLEYELKLAQAELSDMDAALAMLGVSDNA